MDLSVEETKTNELKSTKISSPKITMRNIQTQNIIHTIYYHDHLEISFIKMTVKIKKKMYGSDVSCSGDATRINWMNGKMALNAEYVKMRMKDRIEFKDVRGLVGRIMPFLKYSWTLTSGFKDKEHQYLRTWICPRYGGSMSSEIDQEDIQKFVRKYNLTDEDFTRTTKCMYQENDRKIKICFGKITK